MIKKNVLGRSGINVSAMSLGSWMTYEYIGEKKSNALFGAAFDAGINFFDDARYDDLTGDAPIKTGYSEVLFGNLLRAGHWTRDQLVISNKIWFQFFPEQSIEEEIKGSLTRMRQEYIDIMYTFAPPEGLSMEELVAQMNGAIEKGLIRFWGLINWPKESIEALDKVLTETGANGPVAAQQSYSLLHRESVEADWFQNFAIKYNVDVMASHSLVGGILTGKYSQSMVAQKDSRHGSDAHLANRLSIMQQNGMLGSADVVVEAAKKLGVTPAQLAMSFALRGPRVSSLLFGTRSPEQLATNLKALELLDRDCGDVYSELVAKIPEVSEAVLIQLGEPPVGAIKLNDEERQAHIKIGK